MVRIHVRAPAFNAKSRSFQVAKDSLRLCALGPLRFGVLPGLWCNSSISAREADGPGANPGFLTNFN